MVGFGTPGKGLDQIRNQENLYLDPWHTSIAQFCQKIGFPGVPNGICIYVQVAHVTMNCWRPSTPTSSYLHVFKAQVARSNNKPWRDLRSHPKKWHVLKLDVDSRGGLLYVVYKCYHALGLFILRKAPSKKKMCISVKLEVHNFVLQTFGANIELYRHAECGNRW